MLNSKIEICLKKKNHLELKYSVTFIMRIGRETVNLGQSQKLSARNLSRAKLIRPISYSHSVQKKREINRLYYNNNYIFGKVIINYKQQF